MRRRTMDSWRIMVLALVVTVLSVTCCHAWTNRALSLPRVTTGGNFNSERVLRASRPRTAQTFYASRNDGEFENPSSSPLLLDRESSLSNSGNSLEPNNNNSLSRRSLLQASVAATAAAALLSIQPAAAASTDAKLVHDDLDCLKDLPPIPDDCVRVFLCRHGQTENNRQRIVQGSRVDAPVNANGRNQAANMGDALGRLDPRPRLFFSSNLQRAKMTAEIAANVCESFRSDYVAPKQLPSLAEIDFGPVADGQPIETVKEGMKDAYLKWAVGDIDYRPEGGGDTGREVLTRAAEALEALVGEANAAEVSCVAAVSHSAYLRVLLSLILNEPLLLAQNRKIRNGSVTVVDVPKDLKERRVVGPKSVLIGGPLSRAPSDFQLSVPVCKMVRITETRHLPLDIV